MYEPHATIKWSTHSCFKAIHLPEKYSWVMAHRGKSVCFSACAFGDNSWLISPFKWPCGTQSLNKQRPANPLHSFSLYLSFKILFSPLFPWLITPLHALSVPSPPPPHLNIHLSKAWYRYKCKRKVRQSPNLNKFTIIASPVVAEVSDPSLFNLSNILLAWSPVKKRLWGLFNRDPNRVSFFFLCWHHG